MVNLLDRLRAGSGSRLFVHCATSVEYLAELNASTPGVERYAERALLLAERQDLVCVTDEIEPAYLEFLAGLGLGPDPANLIVASRFHDRRGRPLWEGLLESEEALTVLGCRMQRLGTTQLHPFISSRGQFELAEALSQKTGASVRVTGGDPDLVAYADHKHHITAKARELGIPVAPGEIVELGGIEQSPEGRHVALRWAMERQVGRTGQVIVRGASGAAGSATFMAAGDEQLDALARRLSRRTDNRIYLVEAMVEATASPNVQIHVSHDGSTEYVGASDQLLDEQLVHRGNAYPSAARCIGDMIRWARIFGEWLGDMGFAGIAGFDFVEYIGSDGAAKALLAELNPRVNGATYPLAVRERLNATSAFVSGTIATQAGSFVEVCERLPHLLYSRERGTGILPYAPGCLEYGKCGLVALAPSRGEAAELFAEAELSLGAAAFASEPVQS